MSVLEPDAKKPGKSRAVRVIGIVLFVVIYIVMLVAGGELRRAALVGIEVFPFAILAILAYAATSSGKKALAIVYWSLLIGGVGLMAILMTFAADLPKLQSLSPSGTGDGHPAMPPEILFPVLLRAALAAGGAFIAVVIGSACFFPSVRIRAARLLNIDAQSFVHTTAVATAVASTLILLVPLIIVHEPPLLIFIRTANLSKMDLGMDLRSMIYVLIWIVPASFAAVGFPQIRTLEEARQRLGLMWPGRRQILGAALVLPVLLAFSYLMDHGISGLWHWLKWPETDSDSVELLFGFASRPAGALIASVTAGFGEEIVFRGVLQPSLGIILPALMFASLHAWQYNFDALLQVLCLGLIFGVIRKYSNTTICALVHGSFDFVLFMIAYLSGHGH